MRREALALVLALAAAGCAAAPARPGPRACASGAGEGWQELHTAHFLVRTNTDEPERLVGELEWGFERVFEVLGLRPPEHAPPFQVVVFRSLDELEEFAPPDVSAYVHGKRFGEPELVFAFGSSRRTPVLHVAKEIARLVLMRHLPNQPRWLALGAPFYVGGLAIAARAPTRRGSVLAAPYRDAKAAGVTVRELLSDGQLPGAAWKLAWVLVHYLSEGHPERMRELLRGLPASEDPAAAFSSAFPEWAASTPDGPERLEAVLGAWAHAPLPPPPRLLRPPTPGAAARATPIPPAEVHALRLRLPLFRQELRPRRNAEAEELLAEAPSHPFALWFLAEQRPAAERLAVARRAVEGAPDSAFAWAILADALPEGSPEVIAARRRAVELAPGAPILENNLAWDLFKGGHLDEALWYARRAVALAPWNPYAMETLASVLEELGYCREELAWRRRALEALQDRSIPAVATARDRLARVSPRCGTAGAAPGGAGAVEPVR